VCRSFKSFEQARKAALEKRFGEEVKIGGAEGLIVIRSALKAAVDEDPCPETDSKLHSERRFPSVADTACRREVMSKFLPKFQKCAKMSDIEATGCQFVKNWHKKTRRLLL